MARQKIIVALGIVAALGAMAWGYQTYSARHEALKLYGAIDMKTMSLAFEETGRVASLAVEEGAKVKAGDVLATLQDDRYRIARESAAADVAVAQAQLKLLQAGSRREDIEAGRARLRAAQNAYTLADRTCRRQKQMASATSALRRDEACYQAKVALANRDEAQKALELLLAGTRLEEIDVARASLAQAQTRLMDAERALKNCELKAAADGVIRARLKEPGDMVNASVPIYEVALMNPLWARVYIDETNLGKIALGQAVRVTVDSYPEKAFEATVGFISTVAEFTPKTVQTEAVRTNLVYEVRLTLADPEGLLRLGMPVTASLE